MPPSGALLNIEDTFFILGGRSGGRTQIKSPAVSLQKAVTPQLGEIICHPDAPIGTIITRHRIRAEFVALERKGHAGKKIGKNDPFTLTGGSFFRRGWSYDLAFALKRSRLEDGGLYPEVWILNDYRLAPVGSATCCSRY